MITVILDLDKNENVKNMREIVDWLNEFVGVQFKKPNYYIDREALMQFERSYHDWYGLMSINGCYFYFKNIEKATLFKLTWA